MKPTERELPPGLPPLPPRTRYAGQFKDYSDGSIVYGHVWELGDQKWTESDYWDSCDSDEIYGQHLWHLAVPIEDEAEPQPDQSAQIKKLEGIIADAAELLNEIRKGELNEQDEAEKWLRAYAPQYLRPALTDAKPMPAELSRALDEHWLDLLDNNLTPPEPQDTEVARIRKTLETLIAWSVRDLGEAGVKQLLDMLTPPTEPKP